MAMMVQGRELLEVDVIVKDDDVRRPEKGNT